MNAYKKALLIQAALFFLTLMWKLTEGCDHI